MGQSSKHLTAEMKAFLCMSLVAAASAAPQLLAGHHGLVGHGLVGHGLVGHGVVARPAGQISHQSVSKPFQGEHRATTQSKAFGATVAAVADRPNILHGARHGVVGGLAHGVVGHGLAHGLVGHGIARPVVHAAPAYRAIAHPVAHAVAEVYPDEVSPYTYQYAVADDYFGSNFQASETDDGTAARTGSYSVALPDGRTQHVSYTANDIDGYVATVTYDGQAAYPQAVAVAHPVAHAIARPVAYAAPVVHAAPLVHAAVHAAPVYRGAGQVSHQSVSKPYQGEHRATTQSKAFGATVAAVHDSPSRLNGAHSRNGLALVGHGALIG